MRWQLPAGCMIEWNEYSDTFTLATVNNYVIMLPNPDYDMMYDNWVSYTETQANVPLGTFTKELGDLYGEYRKAKSQIYGSTYQGPYQSARGTQSGTAIQNALAQARLANYAAAQTNAYNPLAGTGMTNGAGMTNPALMPMPALGSGLPPSAPPHAPTDLKSEGIRVGEIIAWRAWIVGGDVLYSIVVSDIWNPIEPMSGDPAAGFGVHAYKGPHGPLLDGYAQKGNGQWVIGEVALWGEVIEHEDGYRAEFARVHSLVTWSENVSAHLRQVITEKYITSQPVYKIEDAEMHP